MAASITSARITMPGPPPNGVSSTERCLSRAKSRMSTVSSDQIPASSALPASEWPSGPGNISGKIVSTLARQPAIAALALLLRRRLAAGLGRRVDHQPPARDIDDRHRLAGEGHREAAAVRQ